MSSKIYCAVIGDIIASRKLNDREKIRHKLKTTITSLNKKYSKNLTADFLIYAGDEIQGLLNKPSLSYQIINELKKNLFPVELAFGVGIGKISTAIPEEAVTWELDGEAYHRAREMINRAKSQKPTICYSFSGKTSELINSLLYFIETNRNFRTKRQQEVVQLYEKLNNQEQVGKKLNIDQTTVSRILSRALYYPIKEAEEKITNYLTKFDK